MKQIGFFWPAFAPKRVLLSAVLSATGLLLAGLSLSAKPTGLIGGVKSDGLSLEDKKAKLMGGLSGRDGGDGFDPTYLLGVTCNSSTDCWAVGASASAVIQHWNGSRWSVVANPTVGSVSYLSDATCVTSTDCWAVGGYYNDASGRFETLIEHWNGTDWSEVSSPNATASIPNGLDAVTCNSASDCWAVGSYGAYTTFPHQTLIEHWDGLSWSIVASPNTSSIQENFLSDVACTGPSDCWAVGHTTFSTQGLVEHWDGISWSLVSSPPGSPLAINGVTCNSSDECWAVGYLHTGNGNQSLVERWDGNTWTIFSIVSNGKGSSLSRVKCTSATDCWAVGDDSQSNGITVVHWDGVSWTSVKPEDPGADGEGLTAVACVTGQDCWAVGYTASSGQLFEHWNGDAWTIFSIPAPELMTVVSRKVHGTTGPWDIDLPLTGSPGVECRFGGQHRDYQIIFTFGTDLTNVGDVSTNAGSVSGFSIGPATNQFTVNLTGVPNAQYVTVTLGTVHDIDGGSGKASSTMGVLIGDSSGNGVINSTDLSQTKARVGQPITTNTFRSDIQPNGSVNAADISLVKLNMGTSLP